MKIYCVGKAAIRPAQACKARRTAKSLAVLEGIARAGFVLPKSRLGLQINHYTIIRRNTPRRCNWSSRRMRPVACGANSERSSYSLEALLREIATALAEGDSANDQDPSVEFEEK